MKSAERIDRINLLRKQALLLKAEIDKATDAGTYRKEDVEAYRNVLLEITRLERIEAGFQDIMTFAKNYFTGAPPHDLLKADTPSPQFHYELAAYLREMVLDPNERKTAVAAPRSHAKSTLVTNIFPIWCTCYVEDVGERYWVIIGDKQDNARKFGLDVIKNEFEGNELLIADFGKLKGTIWNSLEIVTANNVKISAHGAQEALRGLRFGSFRPSIIMDDIESDDSCNTAERIEKMVDWFDRTVLPLGDPKHSKFFLVGTVIHFNSLLNQVLTNRPDWKSFKYQAIVNFPDRMDLWDTFEKMYHSRDEGNDPMEAAQIARNNALKLYEDNKEEMERGAVVLWRERLDLLALMEKRTTRRLAFNSEYQNKPVDETSRVFSHIHYFESDDFNVNDCDIYGACDPSMGQSKRSDPSAIVTIARHRKTGIMYIIDVDVKRRHPDQIIQDIFRKTGTFKYTTFAIETIAFQQFMKDELTKRSAQQGIYLQIKEFKSTVKKQIRITAIEPLVSSGQIRFNRIHRDLIEQMEYFPKGHDDALDCTAMCVEFTKKRNNAFSFGRI
jgi:predicted phage terminase large subunit-like protein